MEASTFGQDHVAKYINQNYYAIRFDAEDKAPIEFKSNTYNFVKTFRVVIMSWRHFYYKVS